MNIQELLDIMARLRSEGGCPWDREQTLDSLKPYLVEECYEVIEALESGDPEKHAEELGDLLLQVVFQSQLRKERGEFEFSHVVRHICEKLIRRHPHVFGDVKAADSTAVLKNWDAIKATEKQAGATAGALPQRRSVVEGIPKHLPALHKAHHIQKRVARVGFDWEHTRDVVAKVDEELDEVKAALAAGSPDKVKEEIGDLLFAVVNLSRFKDISAEAVKKFSRRFQAVEALVHGQGKALTDCTLAELDAHWDAVKKVEAG